jgi:hypothetical protein
MFFSKLSFREPRWLSSERSERIETKRRRGNLPLSSVIARKAFFLTTAKRASGKQSRGFFQPMV